ncbi:MAG: hypothetical protein ACRCWB_00565 [Enterovibrio sp.]
MAKVHLILQGKGGVGKSLIAALLAQYKMSKGQTPLCIDTDPINGTFEGYQSLNVKNLDLLKDNEIDLRCFDELIEMVATSENDVIIDNGASSFIPLAHYLISNHIPALLKEMGHELVLHTVITGGQALLDTINGFSQLISQFPTDSLFVVWLNPYWGGIEQQGKPFEQTKAYTSNQDRISAIVTLPKLKNETYGEDFAKMLKNHQTFDEALAQSSLTIMTRQRLKIIRDQLFGLLDNAMVL